MYARGHGAAFPTSGTSAAVCSAEGKLRGKQPKLTTRQRAELVRMHASGKYTIAELMEVFAIGRATVYRVLDRAKQRDSP
jgi:DNA invertase Pin-like site-specific DNA recombinase